MVFKTPPENKSFIQPLNDMSSAGNKKEGTYLVLAVA